MSCVCQLSIKNNDDDDDEFCPDWWTNSDASWHPWVCPSQIHIVLDGVKFHRLGGSVLFDFYSHDRLDVSEGI